MTITTKYDVDNELWFMQDNKPMKAKVLWLECSYQTHAKTKYVLKGDDKVDGEWQIRRWEKDLFKTKEDLLNSL